MGLQKIGSKAERETRMCHMNNLKSVKAERTEKKLQQAPCMHAATEGAAAPAAAARENGAAARENAARQKHKAHSAGSYLHSRRLT